MRQIITTLILLLIFENGFARVSIKVEPTRMEAGESARLIITAESNMSQNYLPDLTPLTKDFTILSTDQRMSYSFVNGQTHSLNQWVIVILPKHNGLLSIPSLQIGNDKTQAITLEVTQTTGPPQEKLLLLTEVDQTNPYLNEQVIYTVKVLCNLDVVSTEYQPPQIDNAIVASLQDTKHYQTKINHQDYAVEELHYAIFPQKSGEVIINPPSVKALVYDKKLKRITIKEKTIPLKVKSVPENIIVNTWLPAKEINLLETYNTESTLLQEGSTLVREIIVKTTGLPAQLLPHIAFSSASGFSVYAEKPQEQNEVDGENIIGITTIKLTYLLNKSGQATLPGFQLRWFNTVTGKEQVARLPEHLLSVMPSPTRTTSPTSLSLPGNAEKPPAQIPVRKTGLSNPQTEVFFTRWLAVFFALAWLLTLAFWYRQKKRALKTNQKSLAKQLKQACLTNQATKARDLLLDWACLQWSAKKILNLVALEELLPEGKFKQEINTLLQFLYSNTNQTQWKGEPLWDAISSFEGSKTQKQTKDYRLPPLNQIHE